jgi:hypothetical protein
MVLSASARGQVPGSSRPAGRPGRVAATDGNEYKRRTLSPVETARAKRGLPVPTYATLAAWESSA